MSDYIEKSSLDGMYPSNSKTKSNKLTIQKTEKKKPAKIAKGKVSTKKKSPGKKLVESFIEDDADNVFDYVLHDVLIPAAKDTISDAIKSAIDMVLFGEKRPDGVRRNGGKSYISYGTMYNRVGERDRRVPRQRQNSRHIFEDVILENRGEAEEVLDYMVDMLCTYDCVSVADLYDMVGITGEYTDNDYGWVNLSTAQVKRVREGYLIDLPKPVYLK